MNEAYDALKDLADVLGLNPRALSLNGQLGISFGARGSGKMNAHYECGNVVINLTKTKGVGSLAHEWWHALDNYFARAGGVPLGMATLAKGTLRPELADAYRNLMNAIKHSPYGMRTSVMGDYWGSPVEQSARLFAEYVNDKLVGRGDYNGFLSRGVTDDSEKRYKDLKFALYKDFGGLLSYDEFAKTPMAFNGYVYPTKDERRELEKSLDGLFKTIKSKTQKNGNVKLFSKGVAEPNTDNDTEAQKAATDAIMKTLEVNGVKVTVLKDGAETPEGVQRQAVGKRIGSLKRAAETIKNWVAGNKRNRSFTIELPQATENMVEAEMGHGFDSHNITANGISHALKKHGEKGDKLNNNSIPIRKEDTELIPYIMTAPDYVRKGSNDMGRESVRFYKTLSNGYVVVVEKEQKNSPDDMDTITMWAEMSSDVIDARKNASPMYHAQDVITSSDAAKIRKDAETAMEDDVKIQKQVVFHGSGNDFGAFDFSHMSEGEGAQAYGWGGYVTEVKGIGRTYAINSAKNNDYILTYKGTPINSYPDKDIQDLFDVFLDGVSAQATHKVIEETFNDSLEYYSKKEDKYSRGLVDLAKK